MGNMKFSNFQILKILIRAKRTYKTKDGMGYGMCAHIAKAIYSLHNELIVFYCDIILFIPEFNYIYLNDGKRSMSGYWWCTTDKKSRIKAFNKLIRLYIFKTIFNV